MTIDLPEPVLRWSPLRKQAVLRAVAVGQITVEEACAHYALSVSELAGWTANYRKHGIVGLYTNVRK